ncbi:MAG: hypothetical protein WBF53_13965 [Litorimonas sp.]
MTDLTMDMTEPRQIGEISRRFGDKRRRALAKLCRRVWGSRRAMADGLATWGVDLSPDRCNAVLNADVDLRITEYFAICTAARNELALASADLMEADLERFLG